MNVAEMNISDLKLLSCSETRQDFNQSGAEIN